MIDPIIQITDPYGSTAATGKVTGASGARSNGTAGVDNDFASLVGDAISGLAGQLRQAEAVSMAGIKGGAAAQDVVEQVMAAEQALQASISVRDKVVAAYLEISRMAI